MKRTVLSVLALSGTLLLGACGSDAGTTSTAGGSSAGTSASSSASASATAEDTTAKVGDTVPVKDIAERSAAATKEKGTAHLSMTAAGIDGMEADVDFGSATPKMSMTMKTEGETIDMVLLDKVIYMGSDSFTQVTGGKRWIKISSKGDDPMSKMVGPMLDQMQSSMSDPGRQLEAYGDAKAKVLSTDGGETTYEITITKAQLKKALQANKEALPGLNAQALKQIPAKGITYQISLDENDLPTTVTMELQGQKVDMTYSKWGEPVSIKAPPASKIGTFDMPTS